MKLRIHAFSAVIAGAMALALAVPANAQLNKDQQKCQATIAKESGKFLKGVLKEKAKCADKNLKATGSCDFAKRDAKLDKAETKLRSGLAKKCVDKFPPTFDDENLAILGFPGKCADADPSNGFTGDDLADCIFDTHTQLANAIFDLQYGSNGDDGVTDFETRDPVNGKDLGKCQKELGKNGQKFVLTIQKEISKCRDALIKGKFTGFTAANCGDNPIETKPKEKIDKAATKTKDKIIGKCTDALLGGGELDACDTGSGPETTAAGAADCIVDTHKNVTDDPSNDGTAAPFPTDLIDIEYALGAVCGDNIVNEPAVPGVFSSNFHLGADPKEECDGTDDSACPGECGGPTSNFPCVCTNTPRERVIEHDNSDLDNGWTGTSHDSTTVEGSGYMVELYDCDGPGGPDTLCTVGPSCALPPHQPCVSDAACVGGGNFCRSSPLNLAPHCNNDPQSTCTSNNDCPDPGDFCRKHGHGIPLPLSSGGVAVCVVNVFSENVVGTTNLATGSSAVRLRQDSVTHLASGTLNQPCPTCGGFCSGASGGSGPGVRTLCAADSDCPATATCVLDQVCSYGPNEDQPCRLGTHYGNSTLLFGSPSVDCQPAPGNDISSGGLDILFNPSTTGTLTTLPSFPCNASGFGGNKCIFGTEVGKACGVDSDCAGGGVGSCVGQCYCPPIGGTPEKPNDCTDFGSCRGGTNDYADCAADSDCPGGVCEANSCRLAAGVCVGGVSIGTACGADTDCGVGGICGDGDSSGEGFCVRGPSIGLCSFTTLKGCTVDSECRPSGSCSFCKSDNTETCVFKNKDCHPTDGVIRIGVAATPDRVSVAHYCIPASGSSAVNNTAGLPGQGALEQPATTVPTGF